LRGGPVQYPALYLASRSLSSFIAVA
jgi:hypothetical protein